MYGVTALGKKGVPAEQVAAAALDDLENLIAGGGTVDPHLADQLILPLALAPGESRFRTAAATSHLFTNAGTVALFLGERVEIPGAEGEEVEVAVHGAGTAGPDPADPALGRGAPGDPGRSPGSRGDLGGGPAGGPA